ncbi:hypothetical protein DSM03_1011044 [Leeuwenhoekiella aestuarii]|uniref:Uncharacterized protein n=1 Tax=Leeuwenhoekiella aestuarii TaxID=2249426 RepID=A0A4V1KPZ0_9FLAO|nr:hypothetical protein [Leeuwenhoekiella aestuarii]RXG18362.1 hypothetical protein DSM04_101555 [Leeuwenhoekiella aestuarii]RXG19667.1 hypothetical protein DSM03_1011044 [Leeuwenhoekiella aestuarii]
MYLHYFGKQSFTNRAVNKANRILISSFYQNEIEKRLDFIDAACFLQELKSNEPQPIEVFSTWAPFRTKKETVPIQADAIHINRSQIRNSRRLLIVKLLQDYTCIRLGLLDSSQNEDRARVNSIIEKLAKSYL